MFLPSVKYLCFHVSVAITKWVTSLVKNLGESRQSIGMLVEDENGGENDDNHRRREKGPQGKHRVWEKSQPNSRSKTLICTEQE